MSDLTFSEGQAKLGVGDTTVQVPDWFRSYFKALVNDPLFNVSDTRFPSWMVDTVARYGLPVPIGNIVGFSQFTAQIAATIPTDESTLSTSYTDLGTVGPTLTGLPDGSYLVAFGALVTGVSGTAYMGVKVNAAEATDAAAMKTNVANVPGTRIVAVTLDAGGNNTLTARYRTTVAGSGSWSDRWMLALKYANL